MVAVGVLRGSGLANRVAMVIALLVIGTNLIPPSEPVSLPQFLTALGAVALVVLLFRARTYFAPSRRPSLSTEWRSGERG